MDVNKVSRLKAKAKDKINIPDISRHNWQHEKPKT